MKSGEDKSGFITCRLCASRSFECGQQRILDRYDVAYFRCPNCDLIQTQNPFWLAEAYSSAIAAIDTGAIRRNQITARLTWFVARVLGLRRDASCLDYGAGHGVFVRMMRDIGFDYRWHDPLADNLYARGFEGEVNTRHELVTAFEVFEHFVEVSKELTGLFQSRPRFVLVGTVLHGGFNREWWYFTLDSGQHVAFFSNRTMVCVAEQFGYKVQAGPEYSLFIEEGIQLGKFRRLLLRAVIMNARLAYVVASLTPEPFLGRIGFYRSRTIADYGEISRRVRVEDKIVK